MFNVFLDDPTFRLWILCEDKFIDISQVSKQFDATALVESSRFDKPHVLLTVLNRNSFLI